MKRETASEYLLRIAPDVKRMFDEMIRENLRERGCGNASPSDK